MLDRLSVHLQVSSEVGTLAVRGLAEEIMAVEMGPHQYRKYSTAIEYLTAKGAFKGNNVANVAKGVMILRLICFHENSVYLGVNNELEEHLEKEKEKEKSAAGPKGIGGGQGASGRTKSDLSLKDAKIIDSKTIGKDTDDEVSNQAQAQIRISLPSEKVDAVTINVKMELEGEVEKDDECPKTIVGDEISETVGTEVDGNSSRDQEIDIKTEADVKEEIKVEKETEMDVELASNSATSAPVCQSTNHDSDTVIDGLQMHTAVPFSLSCPPYISDSKQQLRFCVGSLSARLRSPSAFDMTCHIPSPNQSSSFVSTSSSFSSSSSAHFLLSGETRSNRTYAGDDCQPNVTKIDPGTQGCTNDEGSCKLAALNELLLRFSGQKIVVSMESDDEVLLVRR